MPLPGCKHGSGIWPLTDGGNLSHTELQLGKNTGKYTFWFGVRRICPFSRYQTVELALCLFTTTHYPISLGDNTTFCRQLDFQSFCLQKPVAQSMSCVGSESIKKLMTVLFVLLKIGLTGKAASIIPRTKVCLSLESLLSVLNIINEAFLIIVSDAFAGCKPYA